MAKTITFQKESQNMAPARERQDCKEIEVQPRIASKIVHLQNYHSLPVEITIGKINDEGLRQVKLQCKMVDWQLIGWLINRATNEYVLEMSTVKCVPQETVERVLQSTNIVDIIGEEVELQKRGERYFACCPFHKENTQTFTVFPESRTFRCFGCGAKGNAIDFLMMHQNKDFAGAVRTLAKRYDIIVDVNGKIKCDDQARND